MKLGRSSDIWSLGIILYQMVYKRGPFSHLNPMQRVLTISDARTVIEYPEIPAVLKNGKTGVSRWEQDPSERLQAFEDLVDVIKSCLQRTAGDRATIPELLHHRFLLPKRLPPSGRKRGRLNSGGSSGALGDEPMMGSRSLGDESGGAGGPETALTREQFCGVLTRQFSGLRKAIADQMGVDISAVGGDVVKDTGGGEAGDAGQQEGALWGGATSTGKRLSGSELDLNYLDQRLAEGVWMDLCDRVEGRVSTGSAGSAPGSAPSEKGPLREDHGSAGEQSEAEPAANGFREIWVQPLAAAVSLKIEKIEKDTEERCKGDHFYVRDLPRPPHSGVHLHAFKFSDVQNAADAGGQHHVVSGMMIDNSSPGNISVRSGREDDQQQLSDGSIRSPLEQSAGAGSLLESGSRAGGYRGDWEGHSSGGSCLSGGILGGPSPGPFAAKQGGRVGDADERPSKFRKFESKSQKALNQKNIPASAPASQFAGSSSFAGAAHLSAPFGTSMAASSQQAQSQRSLQQSQRSHISAQDALSEKLLERYKQKHRDFSEDEDEDWE